MAYTIEHFDSLLLNLSEGPYSLPDPLSIELEFIWFSYPPLPWASPSIAVEYVAPLFAARVTSAATLLPLTAAAQADGLLAGLWTNAEQLSHSSHSAFQIAHFSDMATKAAWGNANVATNTQTIRWEYSETADNRRTIIWSDANARNRSGLVSRWIMNTPNSDRMASVNWFSVNLGGVVYDD
ncbi:MAG TPA: hypothetical protein VLE50_01620, partial [Cellvibrio sp.]|nr:hypothetical protein [Cellvibrio sp.]